MRRVDLVVIGASRGGLDGLRLLLGHLPSDLAPPLVVAQHRRAGTTGLSELLAIRSALPVLEAEDRQPLDEGHVYLAPPDYHLLVETGELSLSTEGRVMFARPSIDVLFESAAYSYRSSLVGVIMTGASEDGAAGAEEICRRGGRVIVQDPASAVSPIAPRAALARISPSFVGPIPALAQWLGEHCRRKVAPGGPREGVG